MGRKTKGIKKKKRFVNFVQSEVPSKSHNTRDTSRTKRRQTRVYLILANVGPTILQYKYAHTRKWLETNIKLTLWESSKCTAVRREWFTCRCANFRRRGQSRTPTVLMKWRISHGKTSSQTITVDHFPLFLSIEMTTMESDQFNQHRINSTEIFHRFDDSNWKHGHDWIATWMESNCNQTTIELEYGGKEAKWINWRPHHTPRP
jgi:hypothetical protein